MTPAMGRAFTSVIRRHPITAVVSSSWERYVRDDGSLGGTEHNTKSTHATSPRHHQHALVPDASRHESQNHADVPDRWIVQVPLRRAHTSRCAAGVSSSDGSSSVQPTTTTTTKKYSHVRLKLRRACGLRELCGRVSPFEHVAPRLKRERVHTKFAQCFHKLGQGRDPAKLRHSLTRRVGASVGGKGKRKRQGRSACRVSSILPECKHDGVRLPAGCIQSGGGWSRPLGDAQAPSQAEHSTPRQQRILGGGIGLWNTAWNT